MCVYVALLVSSVCVSLGGFFRVCVCVYVHVNGAVNGSHEANAGNVTGALGHSQGSTRSQSGVHSKGSGSFTFKKFLFISGYAGSCCCVGLSLVGESGDFSPAAVHRFLLALAHLSRGVDSRGHVLQ